MPYAGNENWLSIEKAVKSLRRMTGAEISQVNDLWKNFLKKSKLIFKESTG